MQGNSNFMKTQYYTATSLDGFIATEDDSLDWLFPLGDLNDTSYPAFVAGVGALAMGSATYEWLLRHADKVAAETGLPWPYTQPAWIFSSRVLPSIKGANMRFVQGDVRPVHAENEHSGGLEEHLGRRRRRPCRPILRRWPAGRAHRPGRFCHPGEGQAFVPAARRETASSSGFRSTGRHGLRGVAL